MQRPKRFRIKNETGKLQSLPDSSSSFQELGGNGPILLLGLGPDIGILAEKYPDTTLYYIECPDFESQLPVPDLPERFKRIIPDELSGDYRVILYTPNKRLFPSFWGPLISRMAIKASGATRKSRSRAVWLPGDENSLLIPELSRAFADAGFTYRVMDQDAMRKNLISLLDSELPEIVISINFNGLDSSGETFFMLREAGIKVAVWLVDNPFHIISGIKSKYWQQVPLLVTDHWFIDPLKNHGAIKTGHLPLAADPYLFNPEVPPYPDLEDRVVFVGRSSFPAKKNFFAGCSFTQQDFLDADQAIKKGIKPDFNWWAAHDGLNEFWPGSKVRQTGFRAEQSGIMWRTASLTASGPNLTVFGDEGWQKQLAGIDLRQPVDYFTTLPSIYSGSGMNLNMTSPLLPYGLTQRNFDIWAAGGFLLTDFTPGLSIFPREIVEECAFNSPGQLPELIDRFKSKPDLKKSLTKKWHELIRKEHTYKHRVDNILNFIQ